MVRVPHAGVAGAKVYDNLNGQFGRCTGTQAGHHDDGVNLNLPSPILPYLLGLGVGALRLFFLHKQLEPGQPLANVGALLERNRNEIVSHRDWQSFSRYLHTQEIALLGNRALHEEIRVDRMAQPIEAHLGIQGKSVKENRALKFLPPAHPLAPSNAGAGAEAGAGKRAPGGVVGLKDRGPAPLAPPGWGSLRAMWGLGTGPPLSELSKQIGTACTHLFRKLEACASNPFKARACQGLLSTGSQHN
jgi:hypothetical protein